jgi:hypothetical protein
MIYVVLWHCAFYMIPLFLYDDWLTAWHRRLFALWFIQKQRWLVSLLPIVVTCTLLGNCIVWPLHTLLVFIALSVSVKDWVEVISESFRNPLSNFFLQDWKKLLSNESATHLLIKLIQSCGNMCTYWKNCLLSFRSDILETVVETQQICFQHFFSHSENSLNQLVFWNYWRCSYVRSNGLWTRKLFMKYTLKSESFLNFMTVPIYHSAVCFLILRTFFS